MSYLIRKEFGGMLEFAVIPEDLEQSFDPACVRYVRKFGKATLFKDRRIADLWVSALNMTSMGHFAILDVPD